MPSMWEEIMETDSCGMHILNMTVDYLWKIQQISVLQIKRKNGCKDRECFTYNLYSIKISREPPNPHQRKNRSFEKVDSQNSKMRSHQNLNRSSMAKSNFSDKTFSVHVVIQNFKRDVVGNLKIMGYTKIGHRSPSKAIGHL